MNPPTVTTANINPSWIYLSWTALSTDAQKGRDEPTYYGLEWNQGTTNVWVNLTTIAAGTTLFYNHTTAGAFPNNTVFKYRTYAMNGVGFGAYSTELSVTTDNTPVRLNTPTTTSVDYNSIGLTWTAISADADTGGDAIIYYYVDYYLQPCFALDSYDCTLEAPDSGTWTEISTEATQGALTTFTHTIGSHFHANSNFRYRICGKNNVGLGACSAELVVLTDDIPSKMSTLSSVSVDYNKIVVSWSVITDATAQGRGIIT